MSDIPNDPIILMSWTNTKLRDQYSSLAALCDDLEISADELQAKLEAIGFRYNEDVNQFR